MSKSDRRYLNRLLSGSERAGELLSTDDPQLRNLLRYWVRARKVVSPAPGVYARSEYWNGMTKRARSLLLSRALQRLHPDWTFCGASAAVAYGLPAPNAELDVAHVCTPRNLREKGPRGVRTHLMVRDEAVTTVSGVRVVSFERVLFDCARTWDFGNALSVLDAALRKGPLSRDQLFSRFNEIGRHYPGKAKAMATLLYADPRSESPGESIARAAMIEEGFAVPYLQVEFRRPLDPTRRYRVDFFWPTADGGYVIGEFDGFMKYSDPDCCEGRTALEVMADERRRESQLSVYGYPIVRFSYADVMNRPRFVRLLSRFGVPRSEHAAAEVRETLRARRPSAVIFSVVEFGE